MRTSEFQVTFHDVLQIMITRAPTIDQSDMDFVYEEEKEEKEERKEREEAETVQLSNMTGESQKCLRNDSDLK